MSNITERGLFERAWDARVATFRKAVQTEDFDTIEEYGTAIFLDDLTKLISHPNSKVRAIADMLYHIGSQFTRLSQVAHEFAEKLYAWCYEQYVELVKSSEVLDNDL